MRVVLIPCSGSKREGGSTSARSFVKELMTPAAWSDLCGRRADLAHVLGIEPGADLGNSALVPSPTMPAWYRYNGHLYQRATLSEQDVSGPDTRVFVVSALFGVVDARDGIRKYNVRMEDRLPDGRRVRTFWRARELARILGTILRTLQPDELHDYLSGSYRKAVSTLPREVPKRCRYVSHIYSGLGNGSDYHRGRDIRALLDSDTSSTRTL